MSDLFTDFPAPQRGVMTLYVLGPGVGEAQVISMPDGRWVVVDCCVKNKVNLVEALLGHFGATRIALLAVTHAHADHLRGIADLLNDFDVEKVWRWAHAGTLDDVLPRLCRMLPRNSRLQELADAMAAIEAFGDATPDAISDAHIETRPWSSGDYEVHPISPAPADVHSYRTAFNRLFEVEPGKTNTIKLSADVQAFLGGTKRSLAAPGNHLSMALSVVWKRRRVVLGGDVENANDAHRGWPGILRLLKAEQREDLVRNATVVKAAHHGSHTAMNHDAWALHAAGGKVAAVVVTPFASGKTPPPHASALRTMSKHAERLALTSVIKAAAAPPRCGWHQGAPTRPVRAKAAAVAVVIQEKGPLEIYVGKGARCYRRRT